MTPAADDLAWLALWFQAQCNGDWEHEYGVTISTLDNPGWALKIDLAGTSLEHLVFAETRGEGSSTWWRCWRDGAAFHGASSADGLSTIIGVFRRWATSG